MNEQMAKMLFKMLGIDASKLPSAEEIAILFSRLAEIPAKLDEILIRLDRLEGRENSLVAHGKDGYDGQIPDIDQGNLLIEDKSNA